MVFVEYIPTDEGRAWINNEFIKGITVEWVDEFPPAEPLPGEAPGEINKDYHGTWKVFLYLTDGLVLTHAESSSQDSAVRMAKELCEQLEDIC